MTLLRSVLQKSVSLRPGSRSPGRARVPRRPGPYRPQLLALEDRVPPGDAVLAGLLAGDLIPERAAGFIPSAPTEEARRLAEPGDRASDFSLLLQVTDDAAGVAV